MTVNLKEKTLGILSSWTENCGNASYTQQLIEELAPHFKKVECIHLDQDLIHSGASVDASIIEQVKKYDFINLQYEAGLYGKTTKKAHRLIHKIINNHDHVTVAVHSIFINNTINPKARFAELKFNILRKLNKIGLFKSSISSSEYSYLRFLFFVSKAVKSGKKIQFIVHRKELVRYMANFGIPTIHHPIVSATNRDIAELNSPLERDKFIKKYNLDASKTYLGIFGFLGGYKGFDVALDALSLLPSNYELVICGQRHPASNKAIMRIRKDKKAAPSSIPAREFSSDSQTELLNWIITEKKLLNRIHYINHLVDEEDFKQVVAAVDVPIFPYYEVGQGGSGPISYATHLNYGARIIASRTKAFEEYSRDYYPKCITFFDQGNHLELSQKIQTAPSLRENILKAQKNFGVDTNIATYLKATSNSA